MDSQGRMQVAAFHAVYKRFRRAEKRRTREEDFAEAIVMTSDEALAKADPALIEQWGTLYDVKGRRGHNS